ncbi:MAG: hypothetical protein ACYC4K_00485 [Thiobacillus sp.]
MESLPLLPEFMLLPEFIEPADVPALEPVVPLEYMLLLAEPEPEVPVPVAAAVPEVPDALPVPCMVPLENCLLLVPGAVLPAPVPVPVVVPVAWGGVTLPLENWLLSAAWTTAKTLAIEKAAAAVVMTTFAAFMMELLNE